MRIEVAFTPAELGPAGAAGRTVIVIDVLRATSTIIEALMNGARDVLPFESVEQAVKAASHIGRDQAVLCGERDVERISGFDLGNSPLEFERDRITDKTLVMTTTNGTRALLVGSSGEACFVASLLNLSAVTDTVQGADPVLLLCAGREDGFAAEDAVCAGLIARRLASRHRQAGTKVSLNDTARAAALLASRWGREVLPFMRKTAAGRRLRRAGHGEDVDFCSQVDRYTAVPQVVERRIRL